MSRRTFLWTCGRRFVLRPALAAVALLLLAGAFVLRVGAVDSPNPSLEEFNSNSVSAFAEAEIPPAMRDGKIPGAVFVAVCDDRVICEKAYGVADLKSGEPVSTDQTLFRVASLSKILTAASALQLVQTHRLDLHRNVNHYLTRFHIAPAFGKPVTLANLLTHSGGFDDCNFGYAARSAADRLSLRRYLVTYQPARVRPPGQFSVYDNYGFALAGYLVQKASGMPFADYVRKTILAPLGMAHSSFSPGTALRRHLATGYWLDGDTPRACRRSHVNITPAAGLCTTASDMSDLLSALLANRSPAGSNIFPASVIQGLETRQFFSNPDVPGRCYGFNRITIAGRRALRQTGQWPGFNSVLLLFPNQHCGLFLAYNLCDYLRLEQRVTRQFTEKFIPPDLNTDVLHEMPAPPAESSFEPLLGVYLSARAPHEAPELGYPREIEVARSPDGNLEINGRPYHEIQPLVFGRLEAGDPAAAPSGRRVTFRLGRDGQATHLITESGAYRRAAWMESARGRLLLMSAVTIVFISALVLWPVMALLWPFFSNVPVKPTAPTSWLANFSLAARGTAFAACALALWFELAFALAEWRLKPFADFYGFPAPVEHLLWVLPVLLVCTATVALFSVVAWCRRFWHPAHRLHYTLLPAALGLFIYIFYTRHLLFVG
jgi:CubicO group peptidase (beta-lactamase class C family)